MIPDPPPGTPIPEDEEESRAAGQAAEFAATLDEFERARAPLPSPSPAAPRKAKPAPRVGERIRCRIVSVSEDALLLDIGARSEAVAEAREFRGEDGVLGVAVGETLELVVVEAGEQVVLARVARSGARGSLASVREARAAELPVRGKVTAVNSGGLTVMVDGVRAFCPLSQMDVVRVDDPAPLVGRVLEFLVTEVDESRHRVVLSRRRLLQREHAERARAKLAALAPGQELDGTVTRLEPFGAFVDLGGVEGMAHVSELSHARVAHPRDVTAVGETVRVKVLRVEPGKGGHPRVALSLKAVAPDPWTTAVQKFAPGMRVPGVVVRLADFGAFVNLAPGVDGLVHVSQVSDRRIQHVRDVLSPGQAVEAVVLAVEPERRRISLSLREAQENPIPRSQVEPERAGQDVRERTGQDVRRPAGQNDRERAGRNERERSGRDGRERAGQGDRGRNAREGAGGRRPRTGRDAREPASRSEAPAPPPPPRPVDDSPTTMQLAFRRAREAAERRKPK